MTTEPLASTAVLAGVAALRLMARRAVWPYVVLA
jgi:hypothetical protein